jgi:hypothetical protein
MEHISLEDYPNAFSWQDYFSLHETLVKEGKTTGPIQNEDLAHYTLLNYQRSKRVFNHLKLTSATIDKIQAAREQQWLLITEAWCGDASQSVPVIAAMANLNDKINLRIVLRDEYPELIDRFLTNGGRAIPILIILNPKTGQVLNHWGPRPENAQKFVYQLREQNIPKEEISLAIQKWYNENKSLEIIEEILALID